MQSPQTALLALRRSASITASPVWSSDSSTMETENPALPVWDAKLLKIFISAGHDYWGKHGEGRLQNGICDVAEVECVAGMGLRGDRYFGYKPDYKGQVTFFAAEVVEDIRRIFKLPKLPASVFRRNLIVQGIDLQKWIGRHFQFQGIEFEGCQECRPCR